jgi:hypothetical protein
LRGVGEPPPKRWARRVFPLDRRDFGTYRIKRGHRLCAVEFI